MAVLEAEKVTKRFGGLVAVSNVDLRSRNRASTASSAPTAPARPPSSTASPVLPPEEGEILFDGRTSPGFPPIISPDWASSRTYQNIRLFKNMTAMENILVGMHPHLEVRPDRRCSARSGA